MKNQRHITKRRRLELREAVKDMRSVNQCDGCRRHLPVIDGIHQGEGYDMIACTAPLYVGNGRARAHHTNSED